MAASSTPSKTVKQQLAEKLRAAAELEHQFTCMYLFAAFSLRKHPSGTSFSEADVETTRRWASVIYMIARQEMEHLAIVNQLLAAIGEPPYFHRRNIPYHPDFFRAAPPQMKDRAPAFDKEPPYYDQKTEELEAYMKPFLPNGIDPTTKTELAKYAEGDLEVAEEMDQTIRQQNKLIPADIPFLFTHFDLLAARRYTVMESPFVSHLILSGQLEIAADLIKWAFKVKGGNFDCILPKKWQNPPGGKGDDIELGDIERYYEAIKQLVVKLGDEGFVPPYEERQVEIMSQYNIYLFPINDVASAKNGIELIVKQGEAVGSSPGFDSHFRHFYDITSEYEQKLGIKSEDLPIPERIKSNCHDHIDYSHFQPYFNILQNPKRNDIKLGYVRRLFDLFNYGYKTMCFCLNGLYGWYSEKAAYPFLSQALSNIVFAPTMTMFIRSIGEVLVLLPSGTEQEGQMLRAAPNFDMEDIHNVFEHKHSDYNDFDNGKLRSLEIKPTANGGDWLHAKEYAFYQDLTFYTQRFEIIVKALEEMSKDIDGVKKLPFEGDGEEQAAYVIKCLTFAHQNMSRLTANLKKYYQDNVYPKFKNL